MTDILSAILMATAATAPPSRPACTPNQVIGSARVSDLAPESATVGLDLRANGLRITDADEVSWPTCRTALQTRVYGGWAITNTGVAVIPAGGQLVTRDDAIPAPEAEPAHPAITNASFKGSTGLAIGDQRAGIWSLPDGTFLIARYRPGQTEQPIPLLVSKAPVLGLFYLGNPDTAGGAFQLWQRLPADRYRYVHVAWSEDGARAYPPARPRIDP